MAMFWILAGVLFFVMLLLHAVAYARARNMTVFLPPQTEDAPVPPPPSSLRRVGRQAHQVLGGAQRYKPTIRTTPDAHGLPWQTCFFFSRGHHIEAWHIPASSPRSSTTAMPACAVPSTIADAPAPLSDSSLSESVASTSARGRGMILFFPGLGCTKDHQLPHAATFHDVGWDTLLVDFPGHGGSTGLCTSLGYHEAEDVANVMEDVRERFAPARIVLAGVSVGAVALLRAMRVRAIKPDALLLEGPFNSLVQTIHNRIRAMGVPSPVFAELLMLWGGMLHGYLPMRLRPERDAAAVSCPVLFLHAVPDAWITEAEARRVYDRLGGGRRLVRFADAVHGECLASDPALWRQEVDAFLRSLA